MENRTYLEYGPSWHRADWLKLTQYIAVKWQPIPDGINSGPVFREHSVLTNQQEQDCMKPKEVTNIEVHTRKKVGRKFPLKCVDPCLRPLRQNVPSRVLHPSLDLNCHSPNTLASLDINGQTHLIYGTRCQKSSILQMAEIRLSPSDNSHFTMDKERNISKFKSLSQIKAAVVNNRPYALLRLDGEMCHLKLSEKKMSFQSISGKGVTDCCLNKDLENNFAFANDEGKVYIYDIVKNACYWSGQISSRPDDSAPHNRWLGLEFDCHPLHLNVASESALYHVDGRQSFTSNTNSRKMFDLNELRQFVHAGHEHVCSFKNVPGVPYLHMICSKTVLLMDNRYCKQPVITWRHMMVQHPSFPFFFREGEFDALAMMDCANSALCLIPTSCRHPDYSHVEGISTPKHFNLFADTLRIARENNFGLTHHLESHFKSPVTGVASSPSENSGTSVWFQNNFGNLFYTRMTGRKQENSGLQVKRNRNTLKYLKKFEKKLCSTTWCNLNRCLTKGSALEGLRRNPGTKGLKLKTVQSKSKQIIWRVGVARNYVLKDEFCFDEEAHSRIMDDDIPINYFPEKDHYAFNPDFLKTCDDPLSSKLLSVWNENDSPRKDKGETADKGIFNRFPMYIESHLNVPKLRQGGDNAVSNSSKRDIMEVGSSDDTAQTNAVNQDQRKSAKISHQETATDEAKNIAASMKKKKRSRADGF